MKEEKSIKELLEEQDKELKELSSDLQYHHEEAQRLLSSEPDEPLWIDLVDKLKNLGIKYKFSKFILKNNRRRASAERVIYPSWEERTIYYKGYSSEEQVTFLAHEVAHVVLGHLNGNNFDSITKKEIDAWKWAEKFILEKKSRLPFNFPDYMKLRFLLKKNE